MAIKIALVGNPNCGKTTLFNALTGANQYVGNWPGVTVEKKEGKIKWNKDAILMDLPGIYSLSPYSPEELIARNYLLREKPDVIINILDGTNLERNLYLTTQLAELDIPMVIGINMIDVVRKNGGNIDTDKIASELGVEVFEISAVKGEGIKEIANSAVKSAEKKITAKKVKYQLPVERAISKLEDNIIGKKGRFLAVKLFERDENAIKELSLSESQLNEAEKYIKEAELSLDSDSEEIIISQRYDYITSKIVKDAKTKGEEKLTLSDKIDKVITHRVLALPIFALIMFLVYFIAMAPGFIGGAITDWANDGVFGDGFFLFGIGENSYNSAYEEYEYNNSIVENAPDDLAPNESFEFENKDGEKVEITYEMLEKAMEYKEPNRSDYGPWIIGVPALIEKGLDGANAPEWLNSLVLDGIVGGVGAVLGFVPQLLILFILLALLEDCGYMSRVAFILDRAFRRFGLSGKSFIPMLVAVGCGVPGIMASRTIEQERDRRMTVMTTGFIPCSAKMPIVGLIAGALFGGSALIAVSAYFVGIGAAITSGIILKKTRAFRGDPAPFVMELPNYHMPIPSNVLRTMWERGWSFIKRAGTVIFVASVIIWTLNSISFDGGLHYISETRGGMSILEYVGKLISNIFIPLGFGNWQATIATILGLVAKEEVVGFFGTVISMDPSIALELSEMSSVALHDTIGMAIFGGSQLCAFSFLVFNLLCAPCFGAMGAIKKEMNSLKWTFATLGYMTGFAYAISMMIYQFGLIFRFGFAAFNFWTVVALILLVGILYLLFRPSGFSIIDKIKSKAKSISKEEA